MSNQEDYNQIKELEEKIGSTKYNKRTERAIGLYKAKLARLKEKQEQRSSSKGGSADSYFIRRSGDASVILVGFPSVGKSTLLNGITDAKSEVGAYAFTTLRPIPGMMEYKHAKIQILDVPGIVEGAASGRGRGKEVLTAARAADMVLIVIDVFRPDHYKIILREIYDTNLRINQTKPDVKIIKTSKGGINIGTTVKLTKINLVTIVDVLREFRINNADVVIREDIDVDQLIDIIENNKVYLPAAIVFNKVDIASPEIIENSKKICKPDLMISAQKLEHLEELKELIYNKLNFVSVFCKEVGKKADLDVPLIMKKNSTVEDMCNKLHKDFVSKFKFSRIWGHSAKFPGQKQGLLHHLADGDIVEIHIR
ncbi:GTP-binding protein [Candidatus Woesearchaeota archaeon]|nr:GTP-binding protein [Candidatus Woesearchaeota archaeon]